MAKTNTFLSFFYGKINIFGIFNEIHHRPRNVIVSAVAYNRSFFCQ